MVDVQQKVALEVNPIELWILYHRVNQNHESFWNGDDQGYGNDYSEIAKDVGDNYQGNKHDLWCKINELMKSINVDPSKTISNQIEAPLRINGRNIEFEDNGDISVGCEDVSYETLKEVYERATGFRKGE